MLTIGSDGMLAGGSEGAAELAKRRYGRPKPVLGNVADTRKHTKGYGKR